MLLLLLCCCQVAIVAACDEAWLLHKSQKFRQTAAGSFKLAGVCI